MPAVLLSRDLLFGSRVMDAAARLGVDLRRIDDPASLPAPGSVSIVLVDWDARTAVWGSELATWCADTPEEVRPRVILFGPHTDLQAHAEARAAGLGPMLARSKLLAELGPLLGSAVSRPG